MSNLPAKPEPGEISPRSPPRDDRHYTARPTPMAPPSQYRKEESRRNDVYIARSPPPRARGAPAHVDSYVASDTYVAPAAYDRREDDRYRRDYADWDRRFGREFYGSGERRERGRWEREEGGRSWDARHDRDRAHRHNDRPPRPRDSSDRDHRWRSRTSVSPTRRGGSHHPPQRRRSPGSPRRRPVSPLPSHSTSPSTSRQPSPARRLKLGSHSIASPHSPRGYSRTRTESPGKRRRSSRSTSSSPSRRKSPRRSYSPANHPRVENASAAQKERTPSSPRDRNLDHQPHSRSESRARTPVKAESVPDTVMSNDSQPAKVKEELPAVTETDGDVKMREHSPPIPTGPRSSLTTREPPKGPRGFVQPPTAPALRPAPTRPDWSNRNTAQPASGPSYSSADLPPGPPIEPEPAVTASLPAIPLYKPKIALNPELEAEIVRVQAQRAQLTSEYTHISKAARRALHELEMATLDLRAAENRRKLADSHVEKARLGVLGIDYLPTAST